MTGKLSTTLHNMFKATPYIAANKEILKSKNKANSLNNLLNAIGINNGIFSYSINNTSSLSTNNLSGEELQQKLFDHINEIHNTVNDSSGILVSIDNLKNKSYDLLNEIIYNNKSLYPNFEGKGLTEIEKNDVNNLVEDLHYIASHRHHCKLFADQPTHFTNHVTKLIEALNCKDKTPKKLFKEKVVEFKQSNIFNKGWQSFLSSINDKTTSVKINFSSDLTTTDFFELSKILHENKNIKSLWLSGECSDISSLTSLTTNIETLYLINNHKLENINVIKNFNKLKKLHLEVDNDKIDIDILKSFPELTDLTLGRYNEEGKYHSKLQGKDIETVGKLIQLQKLTLLGYSIKTDVLKNLNRLTHLKLNGGICSTDMYSALENCAALTNLTLIGDKELKTSEVLPILKKFNNLEQLYIDRNLVDTNIGNKYVDTVYDEDLENLYYKLRKDLPDLRITTQTINKEKVRNEDVIRKAKTYIKVRDKIEDKLVSYVDGLHKKPGSNYDKAIKAMKEAAFIIDRIQESMNTSKPINIYSKAIEIHPEKVLINSMIDFIMNDLRPELETLALHRNNYIFNDVVYVSKIRYTKNILKVKKLIESWTL